MTTSVEPTQTAPACLEELADVLHWPGRADHLDDIAGHLDKASSLARALWLMLMDGADTKDQRDISALRSLACEVADHASAALYIFVKEGEASAKQRAQS
jgi:hypothetical protein